MTFVDTNYFLRFLLNDVNQQHLEAKQLFLSASEGKQKLFTSTIVFFEIYWVLSSFYEKKKVEVAIALQNVLELKFVSIKERQILANSIEHFKQTGLDLEDCYNIAYAKSKAADNFKTFDVKLMKAFGKK